MLRSCFECFRGETDELLWHKDLKPHPYGEFSMAIVQANNVLEDQGQVSTSGSETCVGVYDGHGGPEASQFVSRRLLCLLHRFTSEQRGMSDDVIKKAFMATEEEFWKLVECSWHSQPQMASVGSCCLVGVISNGTMYVANLGDSRAVLGRRGTGGHVVVAERLTTDHNVAVDEVREEVCRLHPDDSTIVVQTRGAWRIKGIIQVSRAIGDFYLKKTDYSKDPLFQQRVSSVPLKRPVLSAEPCVVSRQLRPEDLFVIFASDGLWELLSDDAAVEIVTRNPRKGIAKRLVESALIEAARRSKLGYVDLKRKGKGDRRQFHDDITVVVIYLDSRHPRGHSRWNNGIVDWTSPPVGTFSFSSYESEEPL